MLELVVIGFSAIIGIQDFHSRTVSLSSVLCAGIISFIYSISINGWENIFRIFIINSTIWSLHYACIQVFFMIKYNAFVYIFNNAIGAGDIIFLFVCAPLFTTMSYIVFIILSSASGLIYYALSGDRNIPYITSSFPVITAMMVSNIIAL